MKTTTQLIIGCILLSAISVFMTQCKSKSEPESSETSSAIAVDTIVVADEPEDTAAIEVAESPVAVTPPKEVKPIIKRVPLTLVIKNLESADAPVIVGVYGTANKFPDPKDQLKEYKFKTRGKELVAKIANLKFGTYAIAIYQDENSNGKIDKNFIGIPTEGYAFSKNYVPKIKAPGFGDCSFEYTAESNTITMQMIR